MSTTEKWVAGATAGWAAAFGSEVNNLPDGDSVLSSVAISNGGNYDMFCDVSFVLASINPTGVPYLGLYLIPLLGDGSTYGDGRFGSQAAGQPPQNNFIGFAGITTGAGVKSGDFQMPGRRSPLLIPPGTFKFAVSAILGNSVSIASSGNVFYYRTYNRING